MPVTVINALKTLNYGEFKKRLTIETSPRTFSNVLEYMIENDFLYMYSRQSFRRRAAKILLRCERSHVYRIFNYMSFKNVLEIVSGMSRTEISAMVCQYVLKSHLIFSDIESIRDVFVKFALYVVADNREAAEEMIKNCLSDHDHYIIINVIMEYLSGKLRVDYLHILFKNLKRFKDAIKIYIEPLTIASERLEPYIIQRVYEIINKNCMILIENNSHTLVHNTKMVEIVFKNYLKNEHGCYKFDKQKIINLLSYGPFNAAKIHKSLVRNHEKELLRDLLPMYPDNCITGPLPFHYRLFSKEIVKHYDQCKRIGYTAEHWTQIMSNKHEFTSYDYDIIRQERLSISPILLNMFQTMFDRDMDNYPRKIKVTLPNDSGDLEEYMIDLSLPERQIVVYNANINILGNILKHMYLLDNIESDLIWQIFKSIGDRLALENKINVPKYYLESRTIKNFTRRKIDYRIIEPLNDVNIICSNVDKYLVVEK